MMLLAGRPDLPAATCPRRRQMSRSEAKELGDFIDPGQAGLVIVGEEQGRRRDQARRDQGGEADRQGA
jgi:hypothetical protein